MHDLFKPRYCSLEGCPIAFEWRLFTSGWVSLGLSYAALIAEREVLKAHPTQEVGCWPQNATTVTSTPQYTPSSLQNISRVALMNIPCETSSAHGNKVAGYTLAMASCLSLIFGVIAIFRSIKTKEVHQRIEM